MIKVKIEQFCSLATSPSWQAWLYHHHVVLYRKFISQLQESRGCGENREIMTEVLKEINKEDSSDDLSEFLQKHYPHMLDNKSIPKKYQKDAEALENDGVFQYYNPNVLTYPRRQIFVGPKSMLKKRAQEFLLDKLRGDSIIVGERVYIEYLEQSDEAVVNQIPLKNWLISQYRLRQ